MRKMQMLVIAVVAVAIAAVSNSVFAQSVSFTGDAVSDFAGATMIVDPGGTADVGVPAALAGSIPGWEMAAVYIAYDESTDELKIGIDTVGIAGDADGDGDPSVTSPALAGNGGQDTANFSGQEVFTISLDLDNDGVPDTVTGVDTSSDLSNARTAMFSGSLFASFAAFGAALPNFNPLPITSPSAAMPDLEIAIPNFSELLNLFAAPGQGSIGVHVFLGSLVDDGIGEDSIPGFTLTTVTLPCLPIIGDFRLVSNTPLLLTGGARLEATVGVPGGYGCCLLTSTVLAQNPIIVTSVPGTPAILIGQFGNPGSISIQDFGTGNVSPFHASCKTIVEFCPASASGITFYGQVYLYPTFPNPMNLPHITSNVLTIVVP